MNLQVDTATLSNQADAYGGEVLSASAERSQADAHMRTIKNDNIKFFNDLKVVKNTLIDILARATEAVNAGTAYTRELDMQTDRLHRLQKAAESSVVGARRKLAKIQDTDPRSGGGGDEDAARNRIASNQERADQLRTDMNESRTETNLAIIQVSGLQQLVTNIQAEIDETNRLIGKAIIAAVKISDYEKTGLSYLANLSRGNALAKNTQFFSAALKNSDGTSASKIEAAFLDRLPNQDYWQTDEGKAAIAFLTTPSMALASGMFTQHREETSAFYDAHPKGRLNGQEEARLAADKRYRDRIRDLNRYPGLLDELDGLEEKGRAAQENLDRWNGINDWSQTYLKPTAIILGTVAGVGLGGIGLGIIPNVTLWGGAGAATAAGGTTAAGEIGTASAGAVTSGSATSGAGAGAAGTSTAGVGAGGSAGAGVTTAAAQGSRAYIQAQAAYASGLTDLRAAQAAVKAAQASGNVEALRAAEIARAGAREALRAARVILGM